MLEPALRLIAIAACVLLAASFGLFAIDQSGSASQQAQTLVNHSGAQALGPPVTVAARHSAVRAGIDDAASALRAPFASFAPGSQGSWGNRVFTAVLGILLYGFGLGAVARSVALARLKPPPAPPQIWSSF